MRLGARRRAPAELPAPSPTTAAAGRQRHVASRRPSPSRSTPTRCKCSGRGAPGILDGALHWMFDDGLLGHREFHFWIIRPISPRSQRRAPCSPAWSPTAVWPFAEPSVIAGAERLRAARCFNRCGASNARRAFRRIVTDDGMACSLFCSPPVRDLPPYAFRRAPIACPTTPAACCDVFSHWYYLYGVLTWWRGAAPTRPSHWSHWTGEGYSLSGSAAANQLCPAGRIGVMVDTLSQSRHAQVRIQARPHLPALRYTQEVTHCPRGWTRPRSR